MIQDCGWEGIPTPMRLLRWLNVYPSVCRGIPPRHSLSKN
nr:MAG TPA: hypothetical protein [Caudoviricetes sp.]